MPFSFQMLTIAGWYCSGSITHAVHSHCSRITSAAWYCSALSSRYGKRPQQQRNARELRICCSNTSQNENGSKDKIRKCEQDGQDDVWVDGFYFSILCVVLGKKLQAIIAPRCLGLCILVSVPRFACNIQLRKKNGKQSKETLNI